MGVALAIEKREGASRCCGSPDLKRSTVDHRHVRLYHIRYGLNIGYGIPSIFGGLPGDRDQPRTIVAFTNPAVNKSWLLAGEFLTRLAINR